MNGLPPSEFNLPPGVTSRDIESQQQMVCFHCDNELTDEDDIGDWVVDGLCDKCRKSKT